MEEFRTGQGPKSWFRGSSDPFGLGFDPTAIFDYFTGGAVSAFRDQYGSKALEIYDVYGYDGNKPLTAFSAAGRFALARYTGKLQVGSPGSGGRTSPGRRGNVSSAADAFRASKGR